MSIFHQFWVIGFGNIKELIIQSAILEIITKIIGIKRKDQIR